VITCNGTFDEQVKLTAGAKIYGGFACPGGATPWSYEAGKKSKVAPSTKGVALSINAGAAAVAIEDFEFDAKDGVDPGESSIAAFVNSSTNVALRRVKLVAGKGADGANGAGIATPAASGATGSNGVAACTVTVDPNRGGAEVQSICGGAASGSIGGKGGDGGSNNGSGGIGERGAPIPQPDTSLGLPGIGESGPSWNCSPGGALGGALPGANGSSQPDALGGTGAGTLTSTGYTAPSGVSGLDGTPGQGGGGGGGAKAPAMCGANPRTGASGGSGGGGGCGGKGGAGGMGGGASIALASVDSSVALDQVDLVAVSGGNGGNGGAGQAGGSGGNPGTGATGTPNDSCDGGRGGKGGAGGNGGGGAGGPSLGIAFVGASPTQTTVSFQLASTAAVGGADGAGVPTSPGAGSAGLVANTREF